MRKPIIAAAIAALALGGATMAFAQGNSKQVDEDGPRADVFAIGPPIGLGPGEDTFAADLAEKLGVEAGEVEQALEEIQAERSEERHQAMAEALAEELDGAEVDAIKEAIAVAEEHMHAQMEEAIENREPPEPGRFAATIAEELGLESAEVERALGATAQASFEAHSENGRFEMRIGPGPGPMSTEALPAPPPPGAFHFGAPPAPSNG